ncbi:MAG: heparinase II/III family protein [Solirubrobacteraceae bacterium]
MDTRSPLDATAGPAPSHSRRALLGHYADAVRNLRASQLLGRPRRLISPRLLAVGLKERPPPQWRGLARGAGVTTAPQTGPAVPPHLAGSFALLGVERPASSPSIWSSSDPDEQLFLFTVHSFDALADYLSAGRSAAGDAFWFDLLDGWLTSCAIPAAPAWHPYPLSRRIVVWCAALSEEHWDPELAERMRRSLSLQVRHLRRCIERDIGGNHLLENAVALTIGGTCLGLERIAAHGRRLLAAELGDQILSDGGHEERSPSYHRLLLDRLTDARNVLQRAGEQLPALEDACVAMASWLAALAGPGGDLPRLNDGWDGPAVQPCRDLWSELSASGYYVLRHAGDQAVLDIGPLCPPHLPPHAHADALSFVLWADGRPLVVDPGSGSYRGPLRSWSRATATHNTVEVDGEDQCVFLGDFRAARLPKVVCLGLIQTADATLVWGEHDGYARLPEPVVHRRVFCWLPGDGLVVVDVLEGAGHHAARSRLHLAPGTDVAGGPLRIAPLAGSAVRCVPGLVAPYLGVRAPVKVLEQEIDWSERALFGWLLLRSAATLSEHGGAVRISRPGRPEVSFALAPPPTALA